MEKQYELAEHKAPNLTTQGSVENVLRLGDWQSREFRAVIDESTGVVELLSAVLLGTPYIYIHRKKLIRSDELRLVTGIVEDTDLFPVFESVLKQAPSNFLSSGSRASNTLCDAHVRVRGTHFSITKRDRQI